MAEWLRILERNWESVRTVLLDSGEEGRRPRQSSPFCGVLTLQLFFWRDRTGTKSVC